jgi:hypothetical protein
MICIHPWPNSITIKDSPLEDYTHCESFFFAYKYRNKEEIKVLDDNDKEKQLRNADGNIVVNFNTAFEKYV